MKNEIKKYKWFEDINGDTSHKRIIAVFGAIVGYCVVIAVVLYGLHHKICSPDVVSRLCEIILGAPFVALTSTIFEKIRGKDVG
jgi:hypothetical protein